MKRLLCLLLSFCLLLTGCSFFGERIREPVTFYYLRSEYRYGTENSVIVPEEREASGHVGNLSYLLALYLIGPIDEELVSPLPNGTRIASTHKEDNAIVLELTETAKTLTDTQYSLACACLTLTCLSITEAESVTIKSGDRSVTMTADTLTLFDDSTAAATTEETQ